MKKFLILLAAVVSCSLTAQTLIINTVAGNGAAGYSGDNGPATLASLNFPTKVTTDVAANIYFADNGNHAIRQVGTNGAITTLAGNGSPGFGGDNGPAAAALVNNPWGVAVDANNTAYFCGGSNYRIRKIDATTAIIST